MQIHLLSTENVHLCMQLLFAHIVALSASIFLSSSFPWPFTINSSGITFILGNKVLLASTSNMLEGFQVREVLKMALFWYLKNILEKFKGLLLGFLGGKLLSAGL